MEEPLASNSVARAKLRELARQAEEIAVILEEAGHQHLPGELQRISRLIVDVQRALERVGGNTLIR